MWTGTLLLHIPTKPWDSHCLTLNLYSKWQKLKRHSMERDSPTSAMARCTRIPQGITSMPA